VNDVANGVHFAAYVGNGNVSAPRERRRTERFRPTTSIPFGETVRATGSMAKRIRSDSRRSTKTTNRPSLLRIPVLQFQSGEWLSRDPVGERGGRNCVRVLFESPQASCEQAWLSEYVYQEAAPSGGWLVKMSDLDTPDYGTLPVFALNSFQHLKFKMPVQDRRILLWFRQCTTPSMAM